MKIKIKKLKIIYMIKNYKNLREERLEWVDKGQLFYFFKIKN
jgi:hypothetical protein